MSTTAYNAKIQLTEEGRLRHFLSIDGLSRELLTEILDTAESFTGVSERTVKKVPLLRGKTITITRRRIEWKHREATGSLHQAGRKPDGKPYRIGVIDVPEFYLDMAAASSKQAEFKCASRDS